MILISNLGIQKMHMQLRKYCYYCEQPLASYKRRVMPSRAGSQVWSGNESDHQVAVLPIPVREGKWVGAVWERDLPVSFDTTY